MIPTILNYLGRAQVHQKTKGLPKKKNNQQATFCPLIYGGECDSNYFAHKQDNLNLVELSIVQLILKMLIFIKIGDTMVAQEVIRQVTKTLAILNSRLDSFVTQSSTINSPPTSQGKGTKSEPSPKGEVEKQGSYNSEVLTNIKIYGKYLLDYFEATILYTNEQYREATKKLLSIQQTAISSAFQEFHANHGLGCVHLRLNKPALALIYFSKAMSKSKQLSEEATKEVHKEGKRVENISVGAKTCRVVFNLALCHYKLTNYETAWKLFERCAEDNVNNYIFWYRFGVCGFNWFMQESENNCNKVDPFYHRIRASLSSRS